MRRVLIQPRSMIAGSCLAAIVALLVVALPSHLQAYATSQALLVSHDSIFQLQSVTITFRNDLHGSLGTVSFFVSTPDGVCMAQAHRVSYGESVSMVFPSDFHKLKGVHSVCSSDQAGTYPVKVKAGNPPSPPNQVLTCQFTILALPSDGNGDLNNGGGNDTGNPSSNSTSGDQGNTGAGDNTYPFNDTLHQTEDWSTAIALAHGLSNYTKDALPSSYSTTDYQTAFNGPLGMHLLDALRALDLSPQLGCITNAQMLWILEHFEELSN